MRQYNLVTELMSSPLIGEQAICTTILKLGMICARSFGTTSERRTLPGTHVMSCHDTFLSVMGYAYARDHSTSLVR